MQASKTLIHGTTPYLIDRLTILEYISSTNVGPSAYARADFLCYNARQMIPYTSHF
ncbi:MAG: hypothetical protein RLZZ70_33 [Candidatus Parcubacteria bacterium]|jgi:hypothetical protein